MTEIGPNISVSKAFLEQVRQKAKDGVIDKTELAELKKTASEDAAGLDSNESKLLEALDSSETKTSIVDNNVQSFKNLATYEGEQQEVDFTKLKVETEESNTLNKWSFGLFGSKTAQSNSIQVTDGNIPVNNNPNVPQTMAQRQGIETENLQNMLGPMEQELQSNSVDLKKHLAQELGLDVSKMDFANLAPADAEKIEARRQELLTKVEAFKADPSKANFDSLNYDLRNVLDTYNQIPPSPDSKITGSYTTALRGATYNLMDSQRLAEQEGKTVATRGADTPANADAITTQNQELTTKARTELQKTVQNAESLVSSLKTLRQASPEAYSKIMGNFSDQDLDLLDSQVKSLKADLASGKPISAAQLSQLNMLWSSMNAVSNQPSIQELRTQVDAIKSAQAQVDATTAILSETTLSPEDRTAAELALKQAKAELATQTSKAPSTEAMKVLTSIDQVFQAGTEGTIQTAFTATEAVVTNQSTNLAQLEQVETTLRNLAGETSLSREQRTEIGRQLEVVKIAKEALQTGNPIQFADEKQTATFNHVLNSLRESSTPAPATTNSSTTIPSSGYNMGSLYGNDYGLGSIYGPLPYSPSTGISSPFYSPYSTPYLGFSPLLLSPPSFSSINPSVATSSFLSPSIASGLNVTGNTGFVLPQDNSMELRLNPITLGSSPTSAFAPFNIGGATGNSPNIGFLPTAPQLPSLNLGVTTAAPAPIPPAPTQPPTLAQALLRNTPTVTPTEQKPLDSATQQKIATLEEISNNPALTNNPDAKAYLAQALDQLRSPVEGSQVSMTAVDSLISSYNDIKTKTGSSRIAAGVIGEAAQALQSGKSETEVQTVLQQQTSESGIQALKQTHSNNETQFVNSVNQVESTTKSTINGAAQDQNSVVNQMATATGHTGDKSISLHFAQMSDTDFNKLDIPGRLADIDEEIAALSGPGKTQGSNADLQRLRTEKARLESTVAYRSAYQGRTQSMDQGIVRLTNQLNRLPVPPQTNAAARATVQAEITEMNAIRTAIQEERDLTPQQFQAMGRAEALRLTGAAISAYGANNLNTSANNPVFRDAYAKYQELLRNPNGFTAEEMGSIFESLQRASQQGTINTPNPPPTFRVTVVEEPTDTLTGSNPTTTQTVGMNDVSVGRAAQGIIADGLNFQVQGRISRAIINNPSLGAIFQTTGTGSNQTISMTGIPPEGPLRDAFATALSDPNSPTSQIIAELTRTNSLPPDLLTSVNEIRGGNAATGTEPGGQITSMSMAEIMETRGGTSVTDPELENPPPPLDPNDPNPQPSSPAQAYLYAFEQMESLSPEERGAAMSTLFDAMTETRDIYGDMSVELSSINEALTHVNMDQAEQFKQMVDSMMLQLALDKGMDPEVYNKIASVDNKGTVNSKTQSLIDEANSDEANMTLAPMPEVSGGEHFDAWLRDVMKTVGEWSDLERQKFVAELAQKMMNEVLRAFYKDRQDEGTANHEIAIEASKKHASQLQQVYSAGQDIGSADNSQAVASMSGGGARSADRSEAFNRASNMNPEQQRELMQDLIKYARQGVIFDPDAGVFKKFDPPPVITPMQEKALMSQYDLMFKAASTPSIEDDLQETSNMRSRMMTGISMN